MSNVHAPTDPSATPAQDRAFAFPAYRFWLEDLERVVKAIDTLAFVHATLDATTREHNGEPSTEPQVIAASARASYAMDSLTALLINAGVDVQAADPTKALRQEWERLGNTGSDAGRPTEASQPSTDVVLDDAAATGETRLVMAPEGYAWVDGYGVYAGGWETIDEACAESDQSKVRYPIGPGEIPVPATEPASKADLMRVAAAVEEINRDFREGVEGMDTIGALLTTAGRILRRRHLMGVESIVEGSS